MGQRLVAIDVSSSAVRLVTLETTLRRSELLALETVPIVAGEDRAALWQRVRQALPQDVGVVVVGSDAKASSTRVITFPFTDQRKIESALDFELENQVPYDLEQTAVAWQVAAAGHGQAHVLTALTPKEPLRQLIAELGAVGLEPRAVVLPAAGLAELVPESDESVAVLSIGATVSHLAVMRKGLRFARTIRAGGEAIERRLAQRFNVDLDTARRAKETELRLGGDTTATTSETRAAIEACVEGLTLLVREIATTFKALPPEDMPTRLIITGGASRLSGLDELLAERLSIPVTLLDLPASLGAVDSKGMAIGPEYAVAMGMALTLMRRGRAAPSNFRRRDLAYHGDLQVYRGEFTRIAVGVGVVFLLAILGSIVQYTMISAEDRQLTQGFCDATRKIVGRPICDPSAAIATLRQAPGAADGVVIPTYSASTLFHMMSKVIGKDIDVQFSDLELRVDGRLTDPDRITGKGEAASFETIEQLAAKLKQDRCVKSAEVSRQKKTNSGRVEFGLTVLIDCPAGLQPGGATQVAAAGPVPAPVPELDEDEP